MDLGASNGYKRPRERSNIIKIEPGRGFEPECQVSVTKHAEEFYNLQNNFVSSALLISYLVLMLMPREEKGEGEFLYYEYYINTVLYPGEESVVTIGINPITLPNF